MSDRPKVLGTSHGESLAEIRVTIDFPDGTRLVLNYDEWSAWQAQRLAEITQRTDMLRGLDPAMMPKG